MGATAAAASTSREPAGAGCGVGTCPPGGGARSARAGTYGEIAGGLDDAEST